MRIMNDDKEFRKGVGVSEADTGLDVERRQDVDGTTLVVAGEIDLHSCSTLDDALNEVLDGDAREVSLNMSDVTFIDSTGVRVLLAGRTRADEQGISLHIIEPSTSVLRLLDLTGLREHFGLSE
jgi:anti-sigma B factor antagonist